MRVFITGAPGTNKFILAINISNRYNLQHFSYRSLVLDYIKSNEPDSETLGYLWSRSLAFHPDLAFKVINKYVLNFIKDEFIIDGFPKSINEAQILINFMESNNLKAANYTIILQESISEVYNIMRTKMVCNYCPYMVNTVIDNPILEHKCPYCHHTLVKAELKENATDQQISDSYQRYSQEISGIKETMKTISKLITFHGKEYQSEIINNVFNKLDKYEYKNS